MSDAHTTIFDRDRERIVCDSPTILRNTYRLQIEGIISKRRDGLCRSGRSDNWRKLRSRLHEYCFETEVTPALGAASLIDCHAVAGQSLAHQPDRVARSVPIGGLAR